VQLSSWPSTRERRDGFTPRATLDEFSALKQLGRTVLFVEFPHENHDLNRVGTPIHRVERLTMLRSWLDRYLQP
jgi:dipeptidyl aminopeptidase/acylaminoacyl peptidase